MPQEASVSHQAEETAYGKTRMSSVGDAWEMGCRGQGWGWRLSEGLVCRAPREQDSHIVPRSVTALPATGVPAMSTLVGTA